MPEEKCTACNGCGKCSSCNGIGTVQAVPAVAPKSPWYTDRNVWINIITLAALLFGGYKADDKIKTIGDKADERAVAIEKKADEAVTHTKKTADTIVETANEVKSFREKMIPKE